MKIEVVNRYQCDVCGGISEWRNPPWSARIVFLKPDEVEFHTCSNSCDEKLIAMSKEEKRELWREIKSKGIKVESTPAQEESQEELWNPHGFWNGKDNKLKTLVWKLDREIWAKVEKLEATQSWGRQESARLILEYIDAIKKP